MNNSLILAVTMLSVFSGGVCYASGRAEPRLQQQDAQAQLTKVLQETSVALQGEDKAVVNAIVPRLEQAITEAEPTVSIRDAAVARFALGRAYHVLGNASHALAEYTRSFPL